jgi:hypothetical protein
MTFKSKFCLKSKRTLELTKKNIIDVCTLKKTHWKFGLKKQLNWFKENITKEDIHNFLLFNKKIVGYTCLRKRSFILNNINTKTFLYFDTLIIDTKYRKLNLSPILMRFNSKIIKLNKAPSFLVCKKNLYRFYKKFNWKFAEKKNFKIMDHQTQKKIMYFNLRKNQNYKIKIFIYK